MAKKLTTNIYKNTCTALPIDIDYIEIFSAAGPLGAFCKVYYTNGMWSSLGASKASEFLNLNKGSEGFARSISENLEEAVYKYFSDYIQLKDGVYFDKKDLSSSIKEETSSKDEVNILTNEDIEKVGCYEIALTNSTSEHPVLLAIADRDFVLFGAYNGQKAFLSKIGVNTSVNTLRSTITKDFYDSQAKFYVAYKNTNSTVIDISRQISAMLETLHLISEVIDCKSQLLIIDSRTGQAFTDSNAKEIQSLNIEEQIQEAKLHEEGFTQYTVKPKNYTEVAKGVPLYVTFNDLTPKIVESTTSDHVDTVGNTVEHSSENLYYCSVL